MPDKLDAQGVQKLWDNVSGSKEFKNLTPAKQGIMKELFTKKFGDRFTPPKRSDKLKGKLPAQLVGGVTPMPMEEDQARGFRGGIEMGAAAPIGAATFVPNMIFGSGMAVQEEAGPVSGVYGTGFPMPMPITTEPKGMSQQEFADSVRKHQESLGQQLSIPITGEVAPQAAAVIFKPFELVAEASKKIAESTHIINRSPIAQKMVEDMLHLGIYVAGGMVFKGIKNKLHNKKITPKSAVEDLAALKTKIKEKFPDEAAAVIDGLNNVQAETVKGKQAADAVRADKAMKKMQETEVAGASRQQRITQDIQKIDKMQADGLIDAKTAGEMKAAAYKLGEKEVGVPETKPVGEEVKKHIEEIKTEPEAFETGPMNIKTAKTSDLFKKAGSLLKEEKGLVGKDVGKGSIGELAEIGREIQKRFVKEGKKQFKTMQEYMKANGLTDVQVKAMYAAMRAQPQKVDAPPAVAKTTKETVKETVGVTKTQRPRPADIKQGKSTRIKKTISQKKKRDAEIKKARTHAAEASAKVRGRFETRPRGREHKSPELKSALRNIKKKYDAEVAAINKKYPDKVIYEYTSPDTVKRQFKKGEEKISTLERTRTPEEAAAQRAELGIPQKKTITPPPKKGGTVKEAPAVDVYEKPTVGSKELKRGISIIKDVMNKRAEGKGVRYVLGTSQKAFKIISDHMYNANGTVKKGVDINKVAKLVYEAEHEHAYLTALKSRGIKGVPGGRKGLTRAEELAKIQEMIESGEYTRLREGESTFKKRDKTADEALSRMMEVDRDLHGASVGEEMAVSTRKTQRLKDIAPEKGTLARDTGEAAEFIRGAEKARADKAKSKMSLKEREDALIKEQGLIDPEAQAKADAFLKEQKNITTNNLAKAFPRLKEDAIKILRRRGFEAEMKAAHDMGFSEALGKVINNSEAVIWIRDFMEAEFTKGFIKGKRKRSAAELQAYNEGLIVLRQMAKKSGREVASYLKDMGYSSKEIGEMLKDMKNPILAGSDDPSIQSYLDVERYHQESNLELKEAQNIDWAAKKRDFYSNWIDVSAELKSLLEKTRKGDIAKKRLELVAGAHPEGIRIFTEYKKKIYGRKGKEKAMTYDEIVRFNDYVDSYRTVQIYKNKGVRTKETKGVDPRKHIEWLKEFDKSEGRVEFIKERAKEYFKAYDESLDFMLKEQLINAESHANLKKQGPYSPRRVMDYVLEDKPKDSSRRISTKESGLKKMTEEGTAKIHEKDAHLLLADYLVNVYDKAFKNRADLALLDFAKSHKDNGIVRTWPNNKKAPVGYEKIYARRDGKYKAMIMKNEYSKQWVKSNPEISQAWANTVGWLSGTKILKAAATGYNPEFAIMNLPRDIFHAYFTADVYSSFAPKAAGQLLYDMGKVLPDVAGVHPVKGTKAMLSGKDYKTVWNETFNFKGRRALYSEEGGMMGFLTGEGRIGEHGGPSPRVDLMKLQDIAQYVGTTSELWTRLAMRERGIKNGLEPWEATHAARNYLDFSQGGSKAKAADAFIPYLNPSIQGTRGVLRAFRKDWKKASWKATQIGTFATTLYLTNQALYPELMEQMSPTEAANNFIFGTPFKYRDKNNAIRPMYFRISKDQGQRLISGIFEGLAAKLTGKEFDTNQLWEGAVSALPITPGSMLPPTLDAALGYMLNADIWRSVGQGKTQNIWAGDDVKKSREFYDSTSPALKKLGSATGISPLRTKYAIDQLLVTNNNVLSGAVMFGLNEIFKDLSEEDQIKATEEIIMGYPGMRRLLKSTNPITKERKILDESRIVSNTKWLDVKRGLDKRSDKYWENPTPEGMKETRDYIARETKNDPFVGKSLLNRFMAGRVLHKLPDRRYWYELADIKDGRGRAYAFHYRWLEAKPSERKKLMLTMMKAPGVKSAKFMVTLGMLQRKYKNIDQLKGGFKERRESLSKPRGGNNGKESKKSKESQEEGRLVQEERREGSQRRSVFGIEPPRRLQ
jgi:hypothetical protein